MTSFSLEMALLTMTMAGNIIRMILGALSVLLNTQPPENSGTKQQLLKFFAE